MMPLIKKGKVYLLCFLAITLIWYAAHLIMRLPIIPSPFKIYVNIFVIFKEKLAANILYSLGRIVAGVLIAIVIGVSLGYFMGYYKKVDKLLSPLIYFTYPVPKMALLPIVMLLFGLGDISKVIMIILIIVFQIIIAARDSVKSIPKEAYNSLYSLGAGKYSIFKEIIIPASLPECLTSIRLAIGTAISILFFTETYGTTHGMGYFIMDAWMRINYIEMYSGIVVLSLLGILIFVTIDLIEGCICSWR